MYSVAHGKSSTAPQTSVQTTQSTPHQPAPDLNAQLLTVADLPAGWSIDNSNGADNASTPSCLQRLHSELHTNDKATASFAKGSDVPVFDQDIGYFGDNATASDKFSTGAEIFNGCTDVSITSEGHKITGSMGVTQFPTIGDQSQAWEMTFTAQGTILDIEAVHTQKGAELEQLLYRDYDNTLDMGEFYTLAQSAADKMP